MTSALIATQTVSTKTANNRLGVLSTVLATSSRRARFDSTSKR
jgi:hypothetical protein